MAVFITPGDPYVPPLDHRTSTSGASHCPPNWTADQMDGFFRTTGQWTAAEFSD